MKRLDALLGVVLAALMGLLVLDVVWQVATRYLLGSPSSVTEEIARYLLIWIGLLGAAQAYRHRMHLAFDLLASRLSGASRRRLDIGIHSLVILFSVLVLVFGGSRLVALTWELNQVSASLQIRLAYVYVILPLSGLLLTLYGVDEIRRLLSGDSPAGASHASEAPVGDPEPASASNAATDVAAEPKGGE